MQGSKLPRRICSTCRWSEPLKEQYSYMSEFHLVCNAKRQLTSKDCYCDYYEHKLEGKNE